MCGRFTLSIDAQILAEHFGLAPERMVPVEPRYNIAPTQPIIVVRTNPELLEREAAFMRWGLVPHWAKDLAIGNKLINARSETVEEKPSFRSAFKRRRCLVPADGFYEWRSEAGRKQPYHIRLKDQEVFGIAGLWERRETPDGSVLVTCTLLTTEANATMAQLHHRMPVILHPGDYAAWLDPQAPPPVLKALLTGYEAEAMTFHPVGMQVNKAGQDDASLIQAAS